METLTNEQLKAMMDRKEDLALINVLSEESFEKEHIPGSINIPVENDFEGEIKNRFPNKNKKLIVYCASFECKASTGAAQKLEEMGYAKVYDYKGGMEEWKKADYAVEGKVKPEMR